MAKYGIANRNLLLEELSKFRSSRTVLLGTMLKIEAVLGGDNLSVRFLKEEEVWDSAAFVCERSNVVFIEEKLWPYIAAVVSPQERVRIAENSMRCQRLMQVTEEMTVGFSDYMDVYLGTVKYIGTVKGIGKCYGIQLHEKKPNNKCDGSCAGINYFHCLPGYGIFTTIDKINPQLPPAKLENKSSAMLDLDFQLQRNISSVGSSEADKRKYDSQADYKQNHVDTTKNFKTSVSLQNIAGSYSVNTNNDFDQNTILQSDNMQLLDKQNKPQEKKVVNCKTEIDLIDAIGGSWSGTTEPEKLPTYSNLKKSWNQEKPSFSNTTERTSTSRLMLNKGQNLLTKTLPKKTKFAQERAPTKASVSPTSRSNFYIKINERSDPTPESSSKIAQNAEVPMFYDPEPGSTNDLTIGSLVEVMNDVSDDPLYGVIRWMAIETGSNFVLAGVELEEEQAHLPLTLTDGVYKGQRFFECANNKALFVPLDQCHKDSRFQDGTPTPVHNVTEKMFGKVDCPVIKGYIAPLCLPTEEDVIAVCGQFRGIQGHHNSCYLDATLFAMFTYTAVFDNLLYRPKGATDIAHYEEVQRVLREEIVNPLRVNLFVRADHVMNLRKLLDKLSSVSGLMSEEKDPEEFLNSLLAQILKAEPFLKLNSGQEAYHYQLFVDKDNELQLPTVQQLFEQSFLNSDIKLKEVPSCLIVQMPRFGKSYKVYPRILPSQLLDVTDVIENSPRQCSVCGKLAKWECKECYGLWAVGLESTALCNKCLETVHTHEQRASHSPRPIAVPQDFDIFGEHQQPPRLYMELFAVVCIETSHYVAFVKCGSGHEAPWCFFDSMADRKGERNGYNVPEMVACPDVAKWLSDEQSCRAVHDAAPSDRLLPEYARRLLCDAYICMYQSPDVMMYR